MMNLWGLLLVALIIGYITIFYLWIYPRYKKITHLDSFDVLYGILSTIITSEIKLYESNIFENRKAITNSNYDNFYRDLTNRIIRKISPTLMKELQHYVTEEMIISMVARTVQVYLSDQVANPL